MNTQTRFKLTMVAAGFLALVTLLALASKMETVATASIAGIMTILSAYIWSQTTRPSKNEFVHQHPKKQKAKKPVSLSERSDRGRSAD